jgi:tetratricopeptide (TPR) repeat protein
MMDDEKWVWADEESDPQALPRLDAKLTPIIDWPDFKPEPAAPADPPELAAAELAPPSVETRPATAVKPPALPAAVETPQHQIPPSVVKAIMLHLGGKLDEAIQELHTGLRNGEPPAELYAAMGALQMELDRYEDAAASYREVLKREPQNEHSTHHLAICIEKANEAKRPPKPSPSVVKAIMLHMEGKIDEAIKELQRGIKAGEQAVDVHAALGHLQFESGRFDLAAEAYREALTREPLHKTCHYNLAVCLEKTGRYKEALESFQKAFEIDPQRIEMGIGVGVSLLHLKRFAEAATAFETCLGSHPENAVALFGRAFALHGLSRHGDAEAVYLEALKRDASMREALANLIALSVEQKKDAATRSYSEKLLAADPDSKVALEALMAVELTQGNYEAACVCGDRLTRLAPDSFEAWFNFGVASQFARRLEHAIAAFAKAARIRPKSFEALSSLGQGMQAQGDLAGAKSAYESALKISPNHPAVLWNLILVTEQAGQAREAERLCALLVSKSPNSEVAHFRLGVLQFERADFSGSAEAFRGCLKTRPDWPAAQLNLGLALWKSGNRDEARQKLEGIGSAPYAADALHVLALIAAEREDYQAALGYYKKLADAGERSPELFYNTGLILQTLGRPDEAAKQYREAIAVKPDLTEAVQALAQITKPPVPAEEQRKNNHPKAAQLLKSRG